MITGDGQIFKKELLDRFYTQNTEMESHFGEDHAVIFPLILEANKISIHYAPSLVDVVPRITSTPPTGALGAGVDTGIDC